MAEKQLVFATSFMAGEAGGVATFSLDAESGTLAAVAPPAALSNAFFLALSPDRRFLYAACVDGNFENDPGRIAAFERVGNGDELRLLNTRSANGRTTCYVDVDPSGRAVVFANYNSGSIGAFPVQEDGSLGEMSAFVQHSGASMVNPQRQEAPHAHCAVISPCGRHVYACDLGIDMIVAYALDVATAALRPLEQPYIRTIGGGGPRHLACHPDGGYVYANNELGNSVNVYQRDTDRGTLIEQQVVSTLPEDFVGESYTADIKLTPDGLHLYCSNRLHDSIAIYQVAEDGCLTLVDIQASGGNFAQNLAITPDGDLLLCANMHAEDGGGEGANIVVFGIDASSGKLTPRGEPKPHARPSCLMIA